MFNRMFNNNFEDQSLQNTGINPYQNTVPNQNTNINPDQYQYGYTGDNENMQAVNPLVPGGEPQNNSYPLQPSLAYPGLATQAAINNKNNYAGGGNVKKAGKKEQMNPYPSLAEMIRQQGGAEDSILAHINPLEAMILQNLGGSGKINPKTGLPQFGFFNNPGKWLKSVAGPAAGMIIGNMILPGLGGVIGGGLGGAWGSKVRGRKDTMQAGLRGAAMGALAPTVAGLAGSGASALGANTVGNALTNYGNQNAIFPSLGKLIGNNSAGNYVGSIGQGGVSPTGEVPKGGEKGFVDMLMGNSKRFFSKPSNLLTTGVLASSFLNRPKEKTPEKRADEEKRYQKALMLNPEEMRNKEAMMLAEEQARRRIARQKFLPEERINIDPLYLKTNTPEEYRREGKWLNYYNNPSFNGNPLMMKKGGSALPNMMLEEEEIEYPEDGVYLVEGETGGQDDTRPSYLPDKTYVVDASTVSDLGDGNPKAGFNKIKALVSDKEVIVAPNEVKRLGGGNDEKGTKILDKMVKNVRKHKRGGINLPPKAKSLASYIRG